MSQIIECPLCRQGFKVVLPSKLAKGSCPKCKGELILSPDGNLKPYTTNRMVISTPPQANVKIAKPPINKQPPPAFAHKQSQVKVNSGKELIASPPMRPVANKKVALPARQSLHNLKKAPSPSLSNIPIPPTKRFAEVGTNAGDASENRVDENTGKPPLVTEKHFIVLAVILALVPFVVGGGLYATRKIRFVESVLIRSGEMTADGYKKLFAVPPPEPLKPLEVQKVQVDVFAKQDASQQQREVDEKEYEKKRLSGILSEKLDKLRLTERSIKKYAEGALTDEQKSQVEIANANLEAMKTEIESIKKEYQDKFGVPFEENNGN